ncbi:unnamed protein product [Euphydryas editha]|uniref:FLYWCH-type domain-containing protein n=1 Tax=Euphydryas editha TaxID=104508 RepID=A0AAU9TIJ6_EUPED|nr:unnamed protein product [Euphydryas editha]
MFNNYTYKKQWECTSGKVIWYCSKRKRGCKAFVHSKEGIFTPGDLIHTHPAPPYIRGNDVSENFNKNVVANAAIEAAVDNGSDDDVIEVVRDEAPIEILSDGEEMEIEKSRLSNLSFSQPFNFAAPNTPIENTTDENEFSQQEDPLKTNFCQIENTFTVLGQATTSLSMDTNSSSLEELGKADEKSNHDSSGENCFINVTDVGNCSDNDAEQLKQKVQQDLYSSLDKDKLNTDISNVPIDNEIPLPINEIPTDNSENIEKPL